MEKRGKKREKMLVRHLDAYFFSEGAEAMNVPYLGENWEKSALKMRLRGSRTILVGKKKRKRTEEKTVKVFGWGRGGGGILKNQRVCITENILAEGLKTGSILLR